MHLFFLMVLMISRSHGVELKTKIYATRIIKYHSKLLF